MNTSSSRWPFRTGFVGVLVASVGLLAGCGGSQNAATLSGKVTYPTPDKPVTGGAITLHPSDGRPLSAPIKWDGTFTLAAVPVGDVKVTIETESIKGMSGGNPYQPSPGMKPPEGDKPIVFDTPNRPRYVKIPKKYSDPKTTTLSYKVEKTGVQTKDFNLTE